MYVTSWVKRTYLPGNQDKEMDRCFYFRNLGILAIQRFNLQIPGAVEYILSGGEEFIEEAERVRNNRKVEGVSNIQKFRYRDEGIWDVVNTLIFDDSLPVQFKAMKPLIDRRGIRG